MEFDKLIKERSSTRKFSNKEVEQDKLNKILEAGRIAPTAKNVQPIKIYIVKSEEGLESIDKASPCRYNAPTVLMICGDRELGFNKNGYSLADMDASIVTSFMMLSATNEGIDNVWVELFDEEILREEFSIPNNLTPVALLPIGYRESDCPISPNYNKRKPLEDLIEYK